MKSLLQLNKLYKSYPLKAGGFSFTKERVHAVNGVSLELEQGKTLGVVGESGCGKTTLGRSLLRIFPVDSGELFFRRSPKQIAGYRSAQEEFHSLKNPSKQDKKHFQQIREETDFFHYPKDKLQRERLKMQYIFQDPYQSLNPKQQVGRIITEAPLEHGMLGRSEWESKARYYLDMVGLPSEALGKYPHEFSGGQRQRINIARAIALNPEFIVCDEPVSSLDVSIQSQILNLLLDIQQEFNTSYLFVAHNLSVVFYLSDWVAVMYAGRVVEQGTARELYDNPQHPYTRLLMAAAPKIGGEMAENPPGLEGEVPSLIQLPRGCAFYDRCPIREERCGQSIPEELSLGDNHKAACFKAEKKGPPIKS